MSGPPGMTGWAARRPAASAVGVRRPRRGAGCPGAGPDGGGSSEPTRASTASGTSGSVKTSAALANTVRARVVSRPGSPGPEPTNVMRPGLPLRPRKLIWRVMPLPRSSNRSRAPSSNSSAATESPSSRARSGVPMPDARITSDPSSVATQPRSDSSSKTRPSSSIDSTTSAIAPTGAEQPASSSASRARSAVTAARVSASSSSANSSARPDVTGTALDCQCPLSRRRQHLYRFQRLGDVVEASDAGQSRPGDHDGVEITAAYPVQPGI